MHSPRKTERPLRDRRWGSQSALPGAITPSRKVYNNGKSTDYRDHRHTLGEPNKMLPCKEYYTTVLKNSIFSGNRREKFESSQQFYTSFYKNLMFLTGVTVLQGLFLWSTWLLWWLILWINFTGLRNTQIAGKILFPVCLQKRLTFKLSSRDWIKQMDFTNVGRHYPIH